MRFLPLQGVVVLLLLLAWGGTGYWLGDRNRNAAWISVQAKAERAARLALEAETQRSQDAARQYALDAQQLQTRYSTLEAKFNDLLRKPLVVIHDLGSADVACVRGADSTDAVALRAGAQLPARSDGAGPDVTLSNSAVWMWNSALSGADTPAGACSAADTTALACAADSGLSIASAWANHIDNARTCAQDRQQLQQLIDFVNGRPAP